MPYGIQQPAVSGQIGQLEKTIGAPLFQRRPFALTPAGLKLFSEIEQFFASLPYVAERARDEPSQLLRLAAPAMILRRYLPEILSEHKREFPKLRLTLFDTNQATAEELLRNGEIDLAIAELEGRPSGAFKSRNLIELPLVLVVPAGNRSRSLSDLVRKDVAAPPLISLPSNEVISRKFQAGLDKLGLRWQPVIEVTSLELVDIYSALGFGIGVSVQAPDVRSRPRLKFIPLPRFPRLTIAAFWRDNLSERAAAFLADIERLARRFRR